jgi:hypothetical protein
MSPKRLGKTAPPPSRRARAPASQPAVKASPRPATSRSPPARGRDVQEASLTSPAERMAKVPLEDRAKSYRKSLSAYRANPSPEPLPKRLLDQRLGEYLAVASPFLYGAKGDDVPYEAEVPGTDDLYQAYGLTAAVVSPLRANRLLPFFDSKRQVAKFGADGPSRCVLVVQQNDEAYLHMLSQEVRTGIVTHISSVNVIDAPEDFEPAFKGFDGDGWELLSRIFAKKKDVSWISAEALGLSSDEHGNKPLWWR